MADRSRDAYLSSRDSILWSLDRDARFRASAASLLLLDRAPDWTRFLDKMERITRLQPRLRQRIVEPPMRLAPPRWVTDAGFELGAHLERVVVPPPGDLRWLLDRAEQRARLPFDVSRPLWSYTLFEGLPDGSAALLQLAHHAMADGLGGVDLAREFFDTNRQPRTSGPLPAAPTPEPIGRFALTRDALAHTGRRSVEVLARAPRTVGAMTVGALRDPVGSARRGVTYAGSALRLMRPVTDTASPVMRARSDQRRYDVLELSFDELHRAAKSGGATVNDAFLTALGTGLGVYHRAHATPVDRLRVTMPISTRRPGDPRGGNRNDAARFEFPVGEGRVAERMAEVHRITRSIRDEPALDAPSAIAAFLGRLPSMIMVPVIASMLTHVDMLASNVPGFPEAPYLCGARADRWFFLGPTEGTALAVVLLSHAGRCCIGITTDHAAIPDPDRLVECLREGFDAVIALGL